MVLGVVAGWGGMMAAGMLAWGAVKMRTRAVEENIREQMRETKEGGRCGS